MKQWTAPEMVEVSINETEYNVFGKHNDGGYVGDGIPSGHSAIHSFFCVGCDECGYPQKPQNPQNPETPQTPIEDSLS